MKREGFTLVELLAVIVILSIILAIAIPSVTGVVNNAKRNAFEDNAKMFLKAVDYKLMQDSSYDVSEINKDSVPTELNLPNDNYQAITVSLVNGKPSVEIFGAGKWSDLKATGTFNDIVISVVEPDTTPPVISYQYSGWTPDYYLVCIGTTFNVEDFESYATAIDDVDGDITDDITFDYSLLNANVIGAYNIPATVSDSSSNETTFIILIRVSNSGYCP